LWFLIQLFIIIVIGVTEPASAERIKDAHRRIMQINHPDKGGSAYMTAKINEAKLILLKGK
jgi:DnaJ-class molecular chaperone